MTLEDLQFIFQEQLKTDEKLYFMLIDGEYKVIERHDPTKLQELLSMLNHFTYDGALDNMPRFISQQTTAGI